MKLENLSESFVKTFAGSTIFGRGKEYHQSGMVDEIQYDPARDYIQSGISGSSGNSYDVEITAAARGIDADCSCPYDGYPCKHIVAVLLTFLEKRGTLLRQAAGKKKAVSSLKDKMTALSKDRLVELLLAFAEKYPDCRRDLLIRIGDDPQDALDVILKQIRQVFRAFESEQESSSRVVRRLKDVLQSVREAAAQVKTAVYWAVADGILRELNEYGMSDEPLEDLAIETLDALAGILSGQETPASEKEKILLALKRYSKWGNCGIVDDIKGAIGTIEG